MYIRDRSAVHNKRSVAADAHAACAGKDLRAADHAAVHDEARLLAADHDAAGFGMRSIIGAKFAAAHVQHAVTQHKFAGTRNEAFVERQILPVDGQAAARFHMQAIRRRYRVRAAIVRDGDVRAGRHDQSLGNHRISDDTHRTALPVFLQNGGNGFIQGCKPGSARFNDHPLLSRRSRADTWQEHCQAHKNRE